MIEFRFRIDRGPFLLDVENSIPSRGVIALFGPSGCGKTTLLRTIAGLEHDPGGRLTVNGEIWQSGNHFLPTHQRPIGYVFQEPSLFQHLTVKGNLHYGLKRLKANQQRISVDHAIELLEIGPLLKQRPHHLSGGEQQRVAIARALAVSPKMLLMDEPLAALDESRKGEILPYLESLHQELEIPLLYVSHSRNEVARLADHLLLIRSGTIEASEPIESAFSRLDLSLSHGPESGVVVEATISGHDDQYNLTLLDFPGGRFTVARNPQPRGTPARLQVMARDVSLTLEHQHSTSILNIFPATVDQIADEGISQVTVRLLLDKIPILARITRKSAAELQLAPGKPVFAQVKSVALLS